jgi:hypothetical protein
MDSEKKEVVNAYSNKLTGKLFGLLKEREKDGEWESFLEGIETELLGLEDELLSINYYTLRAKISSLKFLRYKYFRKTIFECMNLINDIYRGENDRRD